MGTWQRRSSLGSRRVKSATALGRSSLSFFPLLPGRPLFLLPRWRSWPYRGGAMLTFAMRSGNHNGSSSPTREVFITKLAPTIENLLANLLVSEASLSALSYVTGEQVLTCRLIRMSASANLPPVYSSCELLGGL